MFRKRIQIQSSTLYFISLRSLRREVDDCRARAALTQRIALEKVPGSELPTPLLRGVDSSSVEEMFSIKYIRCQQASVACGVTHAGGLQ